MSQTTFANQELLRLLQTPGAMPCMLQQGRKPSGGSISEHATRNATSTLAMRARKKDAEKEDDTKTGQVPQNKYARESSLLRAADRSCGRVSVTAEMCKMCKAKCGALWGETAEVWTEV